MRRVVALIWIAACAPSPSPSASVGPVGILFVEPRERVQSAPPTEEGKMVMFQAQMQAEAHCDDLGCPWFDATTGELVLSAVTPRGRQLIEAAGMTAPYRIRTVAHGPPNLSGSRTTPRSCAGRACPAPS